MSPSAASIDSKRRRLAELLADKAAPLPVATIQEQIWFHEQLQPDNRFYNVGMRLRLSGPLEPGLMERALTAIVARHQPLREGFTAGPAGPVVHLAVPMDVPVPQVDLSALSPDAQARETTRLANADLLAPFDLTTPPLLRAGLARLGATEHELRLTVHHLVFDGWSIGLIVNELAALYAAFARQAPDPLPPLAGAYLPYARAQKARLAEPAMAAHLDYWRSSLTGAASHLPLPTDAEPTGPVPSGAVKTLSLDASVAEGLERLARAEGATLFSALLAGLTMTLGQWTGEEDLVVGTVVADRPTAQTEPLIGCMVNYLPLRLNWRPADTGRALLRRAQQVALGAYAHQDCPFGLMVETLKPPRVAGRNPFYNVALLLQNFQTSPPSHLGPDVALGIEILPQPTPVLDLRFMIERLHGGWTMHLEYAEGVFNPETIEALLVQFRAVLEAMATAPDRPVAELTRAVPRGRAAIAIASTFTAEPIGPALDYWLTSLGMPAAVRYAPFGQVFQTVLDPDGAFARNTDGLNVLLLNAEDWVRGDRDETLPVAPEDLARAEATADELVRAIAGSRHHVPCLVLFGPPSLAARADADLAAFLNGLEARVASGLGAFVVTSAALETAYPVADYDAPYAHALGRVPYTDAMYAALATMVARRLHALRTPRPKVIVLDCDETLWRGVVGEVGVEGVVVDAPTRHLHDFLRAQQEAGVLLCLASKNDEADVLAVFDRHPDMGLRRDHLAAWAVNWRPKSENLKDLAARLNLGLDAFVFLDDNPLECAEVRAHCPQVLTLQVPADREELPRFLAAEWAFDRGMATREDRERTAMVRDNEAREALRSSSADFEAFLERLALEVTVHPVAGDRLARVAQLTQRTNQFNCSTVRRTEAELAAWLASGGEGLAFEVSDRFGQYGLVGAALFSVAGDALVVDTFLLSCRALGRRVEWRMIRAIGEMARARGCQRLIVPFIPTARNLPARDFLDVAAIAPPAADGAGFHYTLPLDPQPPTVQAAVNAPVEAVAQAAAARRPAAFEAVLTAIAGPSVAPAGEAEVEAVLARLWAAVLGAAPSASDDFFAAGGHSLAAVRLLARIRSELGVALDFGILQGRSTFSALVAAVAARRGEPVEAPMVRLAPDDAGPLSFAQERLWLEQQAAPDSPRLNVPVAIRLTGPLAVDCLERALRAVVDRHEPLRTTIRDDGFGPRPVVLPTGTFRLQRLDAEAAMGALAARPFDLARDLPVRAGLVATGPNAHVLLLVAHHSAVDGVSLGRMGFETAEGYAALRDGRAWTPAPLPCRYADLAAHQRQALAAGKLAPDFAYWRDRLANAPLEATLPADPAPDSSTPFAGGLLTTRLPAALAEGLTALARRQDATPFMAVFAGFMALARRHGAPADLVVGTPVAGRDRLEAEPLVGCFLNMLPVRAQLDAETSFEALLSEVRQSLTGAIAHSAAPFERVVESLRLPRRPDRPPVFQLMVAEVPSGAPALDGLEVSFEPLDPGAQSYDLLLSVRPEADGLMLTWAYRADRYQAATVAAWAERFEALLTAALAEPGRAIGALSLGGADVAETTDEPTGPDALAAFEAQVARTPDAPALSFGDVTWTYAELAERVAALAQELSAIGVGPEERVAICLPRGGDLVVAMLATWKAGGAYVPLDPDLPGDRRAFMLEDAQPIALVTNEGDAGGTGLRACALGPAPAQARRPVPPEVSGGTLAYILYTSGSTGRPKGVCVERAQVAHLFDALDRLYPMGPDDTFLAVTTVIFDISLAELLWPLTRGARVVVADGEDVRDGARWAAAIDSVGPTYMQATPAAWRMLLESGWSGRPGLTALSCGEALPRGLVNDLAARVGVLHNLYGPTEATVYATATPVGIGVGPVAIGRPLPRMRAYVLDASGRPVPAGMAGELYLGGAGVARGYWNRPDLTAERFLPDPFSGGRMYRTGDMAIAHPDGTLMFLGREDGQVKIRGHRVELGEIEAVLGAHPAVKACVVRWFEGTDGDGTLCAFVEGTAPAEALRGYLGDRLGGAMVPNAFVAMTTWPQTANGKIDRKALTKPEGPTRPAARAFTEAEARLAPTFEAVLGHAIGPEDDFFASGGHSLAASRLVARLRAQFGIALPLRALYEAPSIAALAKRLETLSVETEGGPGALAPTHHRLRALARLDDQPSAYHMTAALRLEGPLDAGKLVRALDTVLRRHDALRVRPHDEVVRLGAEESWEAALDRLADSPFDLENGPLVRAVVWPCGPDRHVLGLVAHHLAMDGASLGLVLPGEVAEAYAAALEGRSPTWAPAPSYEAIAERVAASLTAGRMENLRHYWGDRLAATRRSLALPVDRPRPATPRFTASSLPVAFDASASAGIRELARRTGTSPFVVFLVAYALYLRHVTGETKPLVFAPVENRPGEEAEKAVGLFANILPHPTDVSGDRSFVELLMAAQAGLLQDWDHQALPYDQILAAAPDGGLGGPLMQVMLNVMPAPSWPSLGEARLTPVPVAPRATRVDWHLWLWDSEGGFTGAIDYAAERFEPATIQRLADGLRTVLARLVAQPDASVVEALQVLPRAARPASPEAVLAALAARRSATVGADEAPRGELERRVAAIWAEALGVAAVGRHADFFELGGHSLAAVRVLARLKAEFGRELPLTRLFATPTVAGLAALLESAPVAESESPLMRLRMGASGAPIVLAHALGGQAMAYAELARAIGEDRAVYALEHPALHGRQAPAALAELARGYVEAIAAALPDGPLVLAGWSAGGTLAHELACQLEARGRQVELLAIFDGAPPPSDGEMPSDEETAAALSHFAEDLAAREGQSSPFTLTQLMTLAEGDRLPTVIAWARGAGLVPSELEDTEIARQQSVFVHNLRSHLAHRLNRFSGRAVLFRAVDSHHAAQADWAPWVGRFEVRSVAGGHFGREGLLGARHVAGLTEALRAAIEGEAQ